MPELSGNLADDEKTLREAVADKARALLATAPFDFPEENVQSRRRYIRDDKVWESLTSIVDPDVTTPAPAEGEPDTRPRKMRLVSIETASSDYNKGAREWRISFVLNVGYGFNDERPENRGNSYDELMRVVYTLLQQYVEDSTLGFSGASSVDVYRARHLRTRFVPSDRQGRPAHVADLEIFATVEVC